MKRNPGHEHPDEDDDPKGHGASFRAYVATILPAYASGARITSVTDASPRLPNWPPPDGEAIGIDRAREYIAWIRQHAGPVLEEAEQMIRERYPDTTIERSGITVQALAKRGGPTPTMLGVSIGCVWSAFMAGSFAMVGILIDREGRLITQPGMNMR